MSNQIMASNYIKSTIKYDSVGFILGKEYIPAKGESIIDNKTYPAKPENFVLYVVIGELRPTGNLMGQLPIVVEASTTKEAFKSIRSQVAVTCKVKQKNGQHYSFTSIDGIPLLGLKDIDFNEYDEDEEDENIEEFNPTASEASNADNPAEDKKSKKVVK